MEKLLDSTVPQERSPRSFLNRILSDERLPKLFLLPGLLLLAALIIYPTIFTIRVTFLNYELAHPSAAKFVGLANYLSILGTPKEWFEAIVGVVRSGQWAWPGDAGFWNSVWVTLRLLVISVGLEMILGFLIALLLNQNLKGNVILRTAVIIPMIIAPVVVGVMWKFMFSSSFGVLYHLMQVVGLTPIDFLGDPHWALWSIIVMDVWEWTPFVALICLAGLSALPVEPFEAAAVDGAKPWQVMRMVTLPLMRSYLSIAFILRFIAAYKTFDPIYIMTYGGPGNATQVLSMRVYDVAFQHFHVGRGAALAFIILVVAIIFLQNFIGRVMMAGEGGKA
jgi:multiple sugar transport system permease protein